MKLYLDYAAATPYDWQAWLKSARYNFINFGNPLSAHDFGRLPLQAINDGRADVARVINAEAVNTVYFCGSGTESINLALSGSVQANWGRGKHIISSVTEHHAVLHVLESLEGQGFEVTYLPADKNGYVKVGDVKKFLRSDTILVSIMLANNENGAVQPIKELTKTIKEFNSNCLVHTDACQAGNWLKIDVQDLDVDLLSLDSSKVYGPKGVGALYVKSGTAINPIIFGGTQENNLRAGTHNVAGIVGFAEALKISAARRSKEVERVDGLKKWLDNKLKIIDDVVINSSLENSLPHIVNFSIINKNASETVEWFNKRGVYISAGAACTTGSLKPSHVILAQTGSIDLAASAVRVSLGRKTKLADLKMFLKLLEEYLR